MAVLRARRYLISGIRHLPATPLVFLEFGGSLARAGSSRAGGGLLCGHRSPM